MPCIQVSTRKPPVTKNPVNLFIFMFKVTQSPAGDQKVPDQTLVFPSSASYFQKKD